MKPRWARRAVKKTARQSTRKWGGRKYSSLRKEHMLNRKGKYGLVDW